MSRRLYTLVYYLALPLIVLRLLLRSIKAPAYRRRIRERFGFFKAPLLRDTIWVHAVSVGETIAAEPVIRQLLQCYPDRGIVVTTMTPTGSERVQTLFGDAVFHVYAPYDIPVALRRFLKALKPKLLIILETELWPNTLYYCRKSAVPVLLANARLSAKSAIGYQKFPALTRSLLNNLSMVVAQTRADANRFQTLGLPVDRIRVSGSIKFDIAVDEELRQQAGLLKNSWGDRLVWIAASTHAGEDEILLQVYAKLEKQFPELLLLLVPRHPERFERVADLVAQHGFCLRRRSMLQVPSEKTRVVVGDTMGELLLLYGVADIAFVGGSLVERGGHNMLEPAAWGLPIITGPSDYNFLSISAMLQEAGGLVKVNTAAEMADRLSLWLRSPDLRRQIGTAALRVVTDNRGALRELMTEMERWL